MEKIDLKLNRLSPDSTRGLYVAGTAVLIGSVKLKSKSSVWPNCVLRGDVEKIVIGKRTNIQDAAIIHTSPGFPTVIGNDVTVGHGAIIHGTEIRDNSLIGMGAVLLDGCKIGKNTIVAAGAVVPENKRLKSGKVYMGTPAVAVRTITGKEKTMIKSRAVEYVHLATAYLDKK